MLDPETLGPLYRTSEEHNACGAWYADETQWILTDGHTYLVGYAPAIFADAPSEQGWRMTSPEELERHVA